MYLPSHYVYVALLALGIAYLMMLAGVRRRLLEWKRTTRICPSCGRPAHRCPCRR
jgi:NADH pyrophosphatase NudC (nudix superfamily)